MKDTINWNQWHRIEHTGTAKAPRGPAISIAVGKRGLTVGISVAAVTEFKLEPGPCEVFEGQGERCGWLLVRSGGKGSFNLASGIRGSLRIYQFRPAWLPAQPQRKVYCKVELVAPGTVAIELPAWFDRSVAKAA